MLAVPTLIIKGVHSLLAIHLLELGTQHVQVLAVSDDALRRGKAIDVETRIISSCVPIIKLQTLYYTDYRVELCYKGL